MRLFETLDTQSPKRSHHLGITAGLHEDSLRPPESLREGSPDVLVGPGDVSLASFHVAKGIAARECLARGYDDLREPWKR